MSMKSGKCSFSHHHHCLGDVYDCSARARRDTTLQQCTEYITGKHKRPIGKALLGPILGRT